VIAYPLSCCGNYNSAARKMQLVKPLMKERETAKLGVNESLAQLKHGPGYGT
jgi:hypothetical protein